MLADVYSEYSALLPFAPTNLADRVNTLISPLKLSTLEGGDVSVNDLVSSWQAALNNVGNKDSFAWVFILLLMRKVLDRRNPLHDGLEAELRQRSSLSGKPLTADATWFEATRRLAANLYHIGRLGSPTDDKRKVLGEAVSILNFLITRDHVVANPRTAKMYFGMRGVAHVLLARTANDPYEVYCNACRDLARSRELGNRGIEATCYLVETQFHLFDRDSNAKHLDEAERLLSEVDWDTCKNRVLWFVAGETWLRKGYLAAGTNHGSAARYFASAFECLHRVDACPPNARIDPAFLAMRRGQAAYKTYTGQHELNRPNDPALLENAIADLRVGGIGGVTLPASLLLRSIERRKGDLYDEAANDLHEALQHLGSLSADDADAAEQLRLSCMAGLVECRIQLGLRLGDAAAISEGCEQFVALPVELREANIAAPVYGSRFLLDTDTPKYRDIVRKVAMNIRNRLTVSSPTEAGYTFAASHAVNLILRTCRTSPDEHSLRVAYELATTAAGKDSDAPAELFSSAGQAALYLAKNLLHKGATEEAAGLFADAGEYFETAARVAVAKGASEGFALQTAYSKAGEAYMRAHAFSGEQCHAERATANLVRSRELGNAAPELVGMLADVAYREGRRTSDVAKLREALRLKTEAHSRGNLSRENRSVSAAIALTLWRINGETSSLTLAFRTAVEAADADPSWPWPYFQLSEIASLPSDIRRNSTAPLMSTPLRPDLVRIVRNGDCERLIQIGSKLAISNQEFSRAEFGSRQPVYVLDDPHDLLRQTVVFKETEAANAHRERNNVTEFAAYLSRVPARPVLRLPEPLLVLPQDGKVVYVMRRARGVQLGKTTLTSPHSLGTRRNYENAIEFLAHYHVWRLGGRVPRHWSPEMSLTLVRKAIRLGPFAGLSEVPSRELQAEFLSLFPTDLPSIPKKDAHPENWLVDDYGNLVMLDLESTGECPLFFELVQLLDDYPFLAADANGWERRIEYCKSYINYLAAAGVEQGWSHAAVAEAYGIFALLRIVFGLVRTRTRLGRMHSSAVRASSLRDDHYFALLEYIAEFGPLEIRSLSTRIRDALRPSRLATAKAGL